MNGTELSDHAFDGGLSGRVRPRSTGAGGVLHMRHGTRRCGSEDVERVIRQVRPVADTTALRSTSTGGVTGCPTRGNNFDDYVSGS